MKTNELYTWSTLIAFAMPTMIGCVATGENNSTSATLESVEDTDEGISATKEAYVTLVRDERKCAAPKCGGYYVYDVNKYTGAKYVSGLDFSASGLDDATISTVLDAPESELVLKGKLSAKDAQYGTRALIVTEAYRGMPGVEPIEGDIFYRATSRNPPIQCFTAPCNNEIAYKLNTSKQTDFTSYSVELATYIEPDLDQAWLTSRVQYHDAIVTALILDGEQYPGGYEQVLDASQVYVRLPDTVGPCPASPIPNCGSDVTTYDLTADRCLVFAGCVAPQVCSQETLGCVEGYSLLSWNAQPDGCADYVCHPTFVW